MKQAYAILIISLLLLLAVQGCKPGSEIFDPDPETLALVEDCQAAVNGLLMTRGLQIPESYYVEEGKSARVEGDYDVNDHFKVLPHLSMQPGYVLDYVYMYDFMGGFPILYARPEDTPRFITHNEYAQAAAGTNSVDLDHRAHIQADGTPEGYLELAIMEVMGTQFYLHWHAGYNDHTVVCNQGSLEALIENIFESYGEGMDSTADQIRKQIRKLDVTPTVEIGTEKVTVQLYYFTKWGGLFKAEMVMNKAFPHKIIETNTENLVEYDCGIMF